MGKPLYLIVSDPDVGPLGRGNTATQTSPDLQATTHRVTR
jgi:hypothetical protein